MKSFGLPSLVVLVAACVCLGARPQQQPPAQQPPPQQPTFRAGVNAVRVDVVVTTREGMPVDTLTEADFQVTEDGKPQKIDSLKLIRVQTRQEAGGEAPREIRSFDDEATELARDDIRIITIFLDDYHVSRSGAMNVKSWLKQFVQNQTGDYDVVALMYPLTPTSALTFTRDRFALGSAIDRFEGRRSDYMPRNDIEANYAMEPPWRIEEIRSQVVASALKGLCDRLGTLNEGRKTVIVVAEALSMYPADLQEVVNAANRSNVSFYTLDAGGLSATRSFGAYDVLRGLAEDTNGRAITDRNDLGIALGAVLRDSSAYYLLGYNSDKGADGKFHEIKVRVDKPGLDVRARKGYWAPTPAEAARSFEPPRPTAPPDVTAALGSLAQPRGRLIRTWVGMSRGESGKTRITFVWEPTPATPGSAPGDRPARVTLTASGPGGARYFTGVVGETAFADAGARGQAQAKSLEPRRTVFDVPPGRLQLKYTIGTAASPDDVLQTDGRDLVVPDLAGPGLALSTPVVLTSRTPREFRELSANAAAVPTVTREFSRSERLLVRFEVYGRDAGTATVTARLLNHLGDPMATLPAQATSQTSGQYTVDLPLASLPRGDFLIQVAAKGQTGQSTALVAVRVTGQ